MKHCVLPKKAILYFLNELDGSTCPSKRPVNALLEVSINSQDIDDAVANFLTSDADCQRSICKVEHHPYWMYVLNDNQMTSFVEGIDIMRDYPTRQSLPPAYRLNGAVDITKAKQVLETNILYNDTMGAYVMPVERSVDIDTEKDFVLAETLMKLEGNIDANPHKH